MDLKNELAKTQEVLISMSEDNRKKTEHLKTAKVASDKDVEKDKKISNLESTITDLNEQLAIFSQASSFMDSLVSEKAMIEERMEFLARENAKLKEDVDDCELLIMEYEETNKISTDLVAQKEGELKHLLKLKDKVLEENDRRQEEFEKVLAEMKKLKNENKMIKEDIQGKSNINIDEILSSQVAS